MRKDSKIDREQQGDEEAPVPPVPEPQADGSPRAAPPGQGASSEPSEDEEHDDEYDEGEDDADAGRDSGAGAANRMRPDVEEHRDKYLRLAAEFDNFRKRSTRERQEAGSRAQADLVKQMLDALDDLGRVTALDPATSDARTVIEGVEMVERKLFKALGAAGLELVSPQDEPFNPELHEAVSTTPALSREDDSMVAMVYQQGYVFKGQLIRPARVVVKQWNG
jgi:molecular chaperone GrpE